MPDRPPVSGDHASDVPGPSWRSWLALHRGTVLAVLGVVVVALAGRPLLDRARATALDEVTVGVVTLDCSAGATVGASRVDGTEVPRLDIGPDGRCQGRVEVANPSRFDTTVVRVTFAHAGLEGDAPVLVDGLTAGGARFVTAEEPDDAPFDAGDAAFETAQPLPAGETRTLVFSVVRARSRCAAGALGERSVVARFPAVTVAAGGQRRDATPTGPGAATVALADVPC